MILAQWGQRDRLMASPDIWLCHQCNDCSVHCPRDAKPGDLMSAVRNFAFTHYSKPGIVGRAVASPSKLFFLYLDPAIILTIFFMMAIGGDFSILKNTLPLDFNIFLPHIWIDVLFIGSVLLMLTFTGISLLDFWRDMNKYSCEKPKMSFISALIKTVIVILAHKRFSSCDVSLYRRTAHMFVLFGFGFAAIATTIAFLEMDFFHHPPPYSFSHPLKIFGNIGGVSILIGIIIILIQHNKNAVISVKMSYALKLFIVNVILVVITGFGAQFYRVGAVVELAYPLYFFHILTVFFLLIYAPYSYFGHMFYRTLAMVFATSIGRLPQK